MDSKLFNSLFDSFLESIGTPFFYSGVLIKLCHGNDLHMSTKVYYKGLFSFEKNN